MDVFKMPCGGRAELEDTHKKKWDALAALFSILPHKKVMRST